MVSIEKKRSWTGFYSDYKFTFLLAILVTLLIGTPVVMDLGLPLWWLDVLISLLLLAAIVSLCFERNDRVFALAFGTPSVLVYVIANALSARSSFGALLAGRVFEMLFLFGSAMIIVRSLFQYHRFSFDSVFGAICGFLFLGLGWTNIYLLIEGLQPGSFQINQAIIPANEPNRPLVLELSYYSFITLTTVGYGDVLPKTPVTRTLAWMEAIAGQFYLAVVVAGLVNMMAVTTNNSELASLANEDKV